MSGFDQTQIEFWIGSSRFITTAGICKPLTRAGFRRIVYKPFWTQWSMNGMYVGWMEK